MLNIATGTQTAKMQTVGNYKANILQLKKTFKEDIEENLIKNPRDTAIHYKLQILFRFLLK